MNENWLKLSVPIRHEDFHSFHELDEVKAHQKVDVIENFFSLKLNLLACFLAVCLMYLLFKFLVVFFRGRNLKRQNMKIVRLIRKFEAVSFSSRHHIAALTLLVLFFNQFWWFFTLMVTLSIKTDTVLVDTSKLVANVDDAFSTERTLCFYKDSSEQKFSATASAKNILRQLYERKSRMTGPIRGILLDEYCAIRLGPETPTIDTSRVYLISSHYVVLMMAVFLKDFKSRWIGILSKPIYSINLYMYHVFGSDEEAFFHTV